jgi:hypothetical protein
LRIFTTFSCVSPPPCPAVGVLAREDAQAVFREETRRDGKAAASDAENGRWSAWKGAGFRRRSGFAREPAGLAFLDTTLKPVSVGGITKADDPRYR